MNKKRAYIFPLLVLSLILSSFFVSAATSPVEALKDLGSGTMELLTPLAGALLGETPSGEWLFAKVLILILLFSIIWEVTNKIPLFNTNGAVMFAVSAGVALLSTRWLNDVQWLQTVLLPYSVLGISITALLPLIIFFMFVKDLPSPILRKFSWIFAFCVFTGLYFTRMTELGSAGYVYFIAAILCLLLLFFDGTLQQIMLKMQGEKMITKVKRRSIGFYQSKIIQIEENYKNTGMTYMSETVPGLQGYTAYLTDLKEYKSLIAQASS